MENGFHRKWRVPDATTQHPLRRLQDKVLGAYTLHVLLGPKNRFGAIYFHIFLKNSSGGVSRRPLLTGLYNQGRYSAYNWIEVVNLVYRVDFTSGEKAVLDGSSDRLTMQLFRYLIDLLPPGGHIMVEYEGEEQRDTARLLSRGIPPAATPLGYELFNAGYGFSFKDWYFAEGGAEGPRKLQCFKPIDKDHAMQRAKETLVELEDFVNSFNAEASVRERALDVIRRLKQEGGVG